MKKTLALFFILCMVTQMTFAQNRTVSGTVRNKANGELLTGVTIVEKGTSRGVITDANGKYTFSVPQDAILVFSFIGMSTKEIKSGKSTTINIDLESDITQVEEVVVVGFGTQKKENLTGAVATVDIKKSLSGKPIHDVAKGLQGVVPGLTITYSNGDVNRTPVMSIRGMGSLNASNGGSPLIVVDNVVVGDISLINPEDIESISVLKDAASTSIYGARAAFGVVLIKSKSGNKGSKFSISYSNNYAWSTPTVLPQFPSDPVAEITAMDAAMTRSSQSFDMFGMKAGPLIAGITKWQQQYANNRNGKGMILGEDFEIIGGVPYFYRIWDPIEEMYQKWIPQQNHNLQITGGTEKLNFYLSGAYDYQEGIMKIKPDILNKYNFTLGVNSKVNEWLDIDAKVMTRENDYQYPYGYQDYYYYMWRWGTYFPYGTYTNPNGITANFRNVNGYMDAASYCTNKQYYTNTNIGATIHLAKTVTLRSEFANSITNTSIHETGGYVSLWDFWAGGGLPLNTALPSAAYDETDYTARKSTQITSNTYLTYEDKFKDHGIKFIGGLNVERGNYLMQFSKRLGLMDVNKGELPLATGTPSVDGDDSNWSVAGLFARVNYNYKGKYLAEVNGRYDGSSNFPSTSRWAFFPSFSLGYRISEEKFMDFSKPIISDLKIRGSYGSIGNQNVGSDRFVATMVPSTTTNTFWVVGSSKVTYIGSPANVTQSLKWETINTLDLGLDVRFWKNQAGFTFDWFQRDNANMLAAGATLPATFGSTAAFENAGSLRTAGWEIAADINHSFSNGLNLYATISLSDFSSKITQWNSNDAKLLTSNYTGKTIGEIWGFRTDGYFKDATEITASPSQVGLQSGNFVYGAGDIKFKNLNGDNIISAGKSTLDDHGDLEVIGNTNPRYQYSFRIGANYKNFDVDVFFQGVGKRDWWATGNEAIPYYRGADVMYEHQMDFWTTTNTEARYPRPYPGNAVSAISGINTMAGGAAAISGNNFYPQDKYLLNLAYLRLKNLTFGYTVPAYLTKKIKMDKVRVYFSGQNLFEKAQNKIPIDAEITQGSVTSNFYGRTAPLQEHYHSDCKFPYNIKTSFIMKEIIKYTIALTLWLMAGTSCSDDYFNRGSQIKFDDGNFWTSEGNVKTFCWEFYNRFVGYSTGTDGDFYFTTFSDDQASSGMNLFATTAPSSSSYWTFAYIRKANLLLARVDKVPMSDDAKNHYRGIARFFRAFEYANLVKRYGDVPWIDKYLDQSETEDIYKPRTSRDVVVDNILADLDFAAANIRTKSVAEALSDKNTVNRNVVNALIARVALYEASICRYQSNNSSRATTLYTKAKNASQLILDQGYTLSPNYKDVYSSLDLASNKEVILYKNYVTAIMTHSVVGYTNSSTMISGLTKDIVDAYLCKDGLPISLSSQYQGDEDITKTLANRDDRLLKTVDNVLCYTGTPNTKGFTSTTGYKITKFDNAAMAASEVLAPNNTTDAPLFWLAETMLNYAEAAVELGTANQADMDKTINMLRARGGVAPLTISSVPNDPKRELDVSALLWEVRRERRIELVMDGFRQWDLRRWKKLSYLDPIIKPNIFKGAKIVPKPSGGPKVDANNYIAPYGTTLRVVDQLTRNYLDPIPTGQLTLYQIKNITFPQNAGW